MHSLDPRNFIRNYLFRRARTGRSHFKKLFRRFLPKDQCVELTAGLKMKLDLSKSNQESIYWFFEELEPSLQWAIKTLLPAGGTFVDCGANAGLMGLLAIHHGASRVLFIEPVPRLAQTIRDNLDLNGFDKKGMVFEVAVSDQNGEVDLYLHETNDGAHSIHRNGKYFCKVKTQRLDEILKNASLDKISFLKVDTEEHDLCTLVGLGDYLNPNFIPLAYVEGFNPDIRKLMSDRGYSPFQSIKPGIDQLRCMKRSAKRGVPIVFFHPLMGDQGSDVLWCGKDSALCSSLKEASTTTGQMPRISL